MSKYVTYIFFFYILQSCTSKDESTQPQLETFRVMEVQIDEASWTTPKRGVGLSPTITIKYDAPLDDDKAFSHIFLRDENNQHLAIELAFQNENRTLILSPSNPLSPLSAYQLVVRSTLTSRENKRLDKDYSYAFHTVIDETDKFNRLSKDELLNKVQRQTFSYFWDFAHPVSGMIRERNTSGETVTTGGTGFGIMAIVVGAERGFITKADAKDRVKQIVEFLKSADRYHGAFSHWYHGATGRTQPFSTKDDGADLVETSLLFQGLIVASEYFDDAQLKNDINSLYEAVEWSFFQNGQNVLTWHWSPNFGWDINLKIEGWNESLITYLLAAASPTFGISKDVYDHGWARNGNMRNGRSFYGITLPVGADYGGPLFLSQYSFLGLNPNGLTDQYANYAEQTRNHTLINRQHAIENPNGYYGYSADCWGFTASDDIDGYAIHSPAEDNGVITPTAALSSMPFTPDESFRALEFFYYKLGDKIWGDYGFKDAFSLEHLWFADSYIAIDQGPIVIGIENYRSGLIWDLFMKNKLIKSGLQNLGFTTPNI